METSSVETSSSGSRGRRFQQAADYSTSESSGGRRFQQAADDFSSVSPSQDERRLSDSEYNNEQRSSLSDSEYSNEQRGSLSDSEYNNEQRGSLSDSEYNNQQRGSLSDSEHNNQQVSLLSRDGSAERDTREDNREIKAKSSTEILYLINKNGISLLKKYISLSKKIKTWMFWSHKINIFLFSGVAISLWFLMVFIFACYDLIKWTLLFTLLLWRESLVEISEGIWCV